MKIRGPRQSLAIASAVMLFGVLASACGSGDSDDPSGGELPELDAAYATKLDDLYRKAQAAGQDEVVVYSTQEAQDELYEAFNRRYPDITIKVSRLIGSQLTSKLEQEVASGNHVADLVSASGATHYGRVSEGWFEKFTPPTITKKALNPLGFRDKGYYFAPLAAPYGIAYNSNEVAEDEVPAGWDDLLDPEWKGKIVLPDPTIASGASFCMMLLNEGKVTDENWTRGLAAQDITPIAETPQVVQALGTGEGLLSFGVPMPYALTGRDDGAPVEMEFPTEGGSILSPSFFALMDGAPNAAAAKLFYSWTFTPEAQAIFGDLYYYGLMSGSEGPEGYPAIDDLDNVITPPPDDSSAAALESTVATNADLF